MIIFEHGEDILSGKYTLQLALASATDAELQVHNFLIFRLSNLPHKVLYNLVLERSIVLFVKLQVRIIFYP